MINHENSCTLEGVIQSIKQETTDKGLEKTTIQLKSTKTSEYKGVKKESSFTTFLNLWGKRCELAKNLKQNDSIRITGSFTTELKETNGNKRYVLRIKIDTLETMLNSENVAQFFNEMEL